MDKEPLSYIHGLIKKNSEVAALFCWTQNEAC